MQLIIFIVQFGATGNSLFLGDEETRSVLGSNVFLRQGRFFWVEKVFLIGRDSDLLDFACQHLSSNIYAPLDNLVKCP